MASPNWGEGHSRTNFRVLEGLGAAGGCSARAAGWLGGPCPSPPCSSCLWCVCFMVFRLGQTSDRCPQPAWTWGLSPPPCPTVNQIPLIPPKLLLHPSFAVLCMQGHLHMVWLPGEGKKIHLGKQKDTTFSQPARYQYHRDAGGQDRQNPASTAGSMGCSA